MNIPLSYRLQIIQNTSPLLILSWMKIRLMIDPRRKIFKASILHDTGSVQTEPVELVDQRLSFRQ
jgi:hypothetical protein